MKTAGLLVLILLLQSCPAFAQDGSFIRSRRFGPPAQQDKGIQWDLMDKSGSGMSSGINGAGMRPGMNRPGSQMGSSKLFADTPASMPQRMNLRNGSSMTINPDGTKSILGKNGMQNVMNTDGSRRFTHPDGSVFEQSADGTKRFQHANGKESLINPDGSGQLSNGNKITTNNVDKSTTMMRPDGLGFQTKSDGTKIFKRSNGLETVKTPEGRVYMRDSQTGQATGRELKK